MKKTIYFALMSAALGSVPAFAAPDCVKLAVSVKHAVSAERASVLEVVTAQINANPGCACEIVKAAIEGSSADASTVAAIVEAAAVAAPDQMRLISQCAVAVAPDALSNVQAVLAKLEPNKGEGKSSKSAKGAAPEVASTGNPLDFPGQGLGPRPGDRPTVFDDSTVPGGGNNPNQPDPDDLDEVTDGDIPFVPPVIIFNN